MKGGHPYRVKTNDDAFTPSGVISEDVLAGIAVLPKVVRKKTTDEAVIEKLVISSLRVSSVDGWIDDNVADINDVKDVLKQLLKMVCKVQRSGVLSGDGGYL